MNEQAVAWPADDARLSGGAGSVARRRARASASGAPAESQSATWENFEALEPSPTVDVEEAEYRRLLGYPPDHEPGARARELARDARQWFAAHGRPWVYVREAKLELGADTLSLDGRRFASPPLHDLLRSSGARRAMLVAVSAGRACEEHARQLWQEGKPDEYFFLEMYGSAVVEHLMATMNGRICALAERDALVAIPHYSPGYTGWDVGDQPALFELIGAGLRQPLPELFEVLSSGMLRPKKSLLAVVGLAPRDRQARPTTGWIPCETCSLPRCAYRRGPYRHARRKAEPPPEAERSDRRPEPPPISAAATYSVSTRALQKWAAERVRLERQPDGAVRARFRFDGTTCANLGQPLAFDYEVELSPAADGYVLRRMDCTPAPGDEGHRAMCAYRADATALMQAIATEKPLLGQPLDDVLRWQRAAAPSGCHCTAPARAHKWGLALEAIHYTLARPPSSDARVG